MKPLGMQLPSTKSVGMMVGLHGTAPLRVNTDKVLHTTPIGNLRDIVGNFIDALDKTHHLHVANPGLVLQNKAWREPFMPAGTRPTTKKDTPAQRRDVA
jgi:hypothetical protein